MSTVRRSMSDDAVSHVVGHWLDEGPSAAPSELLDAALRSVAGTPQLRPLPRLLRMVPASGPALGLGLAGVALAASLVVAVGLGLGGDDQPGIVPTPSPETSDGDASWTGELAIYRSETDGYELGIPPEWDPQEDLGPGYTLFTNPSPSDTGPRFLRVSVGTESGDIAIGCGNCTVTARTMDELEAAIVARGPVGWPTDTGRTTLDGYAARFRVPGGGNGWVSGGACRVYTIWNGRPVVLWLECEHFQGGRAINLGLFEDIVASFRFLEASDADASGTGDLAIYRNEADGYELDVPRSWNVRERAGTNCTSFTNPSPSETRPRFLNVSVGTESGEVALLCYTTTTARTMDELEAAIGAFPPVGWPTNTGSTTLGGLVARFEVPGRGYGGGWVSGGACRAYTIWNGRPVVLTLECEHFGGGRARNLGLFDHIVDSFRFLD